MSQLSVIGTPRPRKNTLLDEPRRTVAHPSKNQHKNDSQEEQSESDALDDHRRWLAWKAHWWHQLQSIPNVLSLSRMCATPLLCFWIVTDQPLYALAGCTVAAVSDVVDGWIAKHWGMETVLGTYLDPAADKVLINGLSLAIWYNGTLPTPIMAIWMVKDVALLAATHQHLVNLPRSTTTPRTTSQDAARTSGRVQEKKDGPPNATDATTTTSTRLWTEVFVSKRRRLEWLEKLDPLTVPIKVQPTLTSKVNTALQFAVLAMATIHPLYNLEPYLGYLCWTTAGTTILALTSYMGYRGFSKIGTASTTHSTHQDDDDDDMVPPLDPNRQQQPQNQSTHSLSTSRLSIPMPRSPIVVDKQQHHSNETTKKQS